MRTPPDGMPDRQTLYNQVWQKPISHLATDYNVRYWDVQNWCKELQIPVPDRGYWTRLRHGNPTKWTPLPNLRTETANTEQITATPLTAEHEPEEPIVFPKETAQSFKVPDRLREPDVVTLAVQKALEIQRPDPYYVHTDEGQFPVRVTKASTGRALRILDTLIKCWRRRGYRIELRERQAFIWLREVRQRISLWEISKADPKKNKPGERKQMIPTGKLAIRMDWWGGKDWRDGNNPLEDQIQNILDHMERCARQLERQRQDKPQKPTTTLLIADEQAEQPNPEPQNTEPPLPPAVPATNPPAKQEPATIAQTETLPLDQLIEEAELWKRLKIVDEYLGALHLTLPQTPEFLSWLKQAQQLRKNADPVYKRLIAS